MAKKTKKIPLSNEEMVKRMAKVLKDKEQVPNAKEAFETALKNTFKKSHELRRD